MAKPYPATPGDTWEVLTGKKVRRRKVIAIDHEAGTMLIEEDGTIRNMTLLTFRSWMNNFGAVKVDI